MSNTQLIGIGAIFSGSVLGGFLVGIFAAARTGNPLWAMVGLCAGLLAGGFAVARLVSHAWRS
ncbi:MAG: hypothetical protein M3Z14_03560 [Candidatus Eremiobacteraeota bacterium]|nr:hypothetical protein [Candidatus Eremiobacteraeota bacterium]